MKTSSNGPMPIIIGIIFVCVGIGLSVWGFKVLKNAKASSSWPTTEGTITSSRVESKRSTSGSGSKRRSKRTYSADVSYRYSVDGSEYTSDKVSFGEYGSSNSKHARKIVGRYPKDKAVSVSYDPRKPDVAVLEPGATWSSYMVLGMGVIFTLVGAAVSAGSIMRKE